MNTRKLGIVACVFVLLLAVAWSTKKALMVDGSTNECPQTVNFTGAATFSGSAPATASTAVESPCAANTTTSFTGAWPISKGGTGATSASAARTALELGTAAVANTGTSAGNVLALSTGPNLNPFSSTAAGTSATNTIVLPSGTAPSSSPADAVQLYAGDQSAGKAALIIRAEGGKTLSLGEEIILKETDGNSYLSLAATKCAWGGWDAGGGIWTGTGNGIRLSGQGTGSTGYGGTLDLSNCDSGSIRWELKAVENPASNRTFGTCVLSGTDTITTNTNAKDGGSLVIRGGKHDATGSVEGSVIIANANGTTKILECNESKVGFFAVTPCDRTDAITQTYSTADRTHAALTSATLTDSSGGTPATTIAAIGAAYSQAEVANAIASLTAQVNALRVDLEDTKQLLNAVIDDLQEYGLQQ